MPFKSKAQQRWMFATNPRKAREWAAETKDIGHLPEKKYPGNNPFNGKLPPMKKQADAAFFEKMARPENGFYFRDMHGREDAQFFKKHAMLGFDNASSGTGRAMNVGPSMKTMPPKNTLATEQVSLGMTGKPMSGMGYRGEGMSGEAKQAAPYPNDWDADSGIPTGFHRPTDQQPEALEAGGERFHSTEVANPSFAGRGIRHGLTETGGISRTADMGHQIGKHASGSMSDYAKSYLNHRKQEVSRSLNQLKSQIGDFGDKAVRSVTTSPVAIGIAALLAARLGMKGIRAIPKTVSRATHPSVPTHGGLVGKLVRGSKRLISE